MSTVGIKYGVECVDKMECVWTEMNEGFECMRLRPEMYIGNINK